MKVPGFGYGCILVAAMSAVACGGDTQKDGKLEQDGSGGATTGGADAAGGSAARDPTGGASSGAAGGAFAAGGAPSSGGASTGTAGGTTAAGGTPSAGAPSSGGARSSGGAPNAGAPASGGTATAGAPTGGSESAGAPSSGGGPNAGAPSGGVAGAGGGSSVTEDQLDDCTRDADCIVVPYSHCCGSTKRAINAALQADYEAHPEWQVFNDPGTCAVIGLCADDSAVTDAWCHFQATGLGSCQLLFPDRCDPITCDLDCPYGLWRNSDSCETCACMPPPLLVEVDSSPVQQNVSLTTEITNYIGGIDRTLFTFEWHYDDPDLEDDEFVVRATLHLAHEVVPYFDAETTYFTPSASFGLEMVTVSWEEAMLDGPVPLDETQGMLSVRQAGTDLEGGVYLVLAGSDRGPASVVVGGSFRAPDPWQSF